MTLFSEKAGKDEIFVERDGTRSGPFRCMFASPKLTMFQKQLDIVEGDKIIRPIPGRDEIYTVQQTTYNQQFGSIPSHYVFEISKDAAIPKPHTSTTNHINIHHSTGIQIGNHNVQHLEAGLKELLAAIEKSEGEPSAKADAKGKLRSFLEHPLTASAVGAGMPALLALLGAPS